MPAPDRNSGLVFYPSLPLVNEDHNKEYPLTEFTRLTKKTNLVNVTNGLYF